MLGVALTCVVVLAIAYRMRLRALNRLSALGFDYLDQDRLAGIGCLRIARRSYDGYSLDQLRDDDVWGWVRFESTPNV